MKVQLAGESANYHPRHIDMIWRLWHLLDLTPGGRGDFVMPRLDSQ